MCVYGKALLTLACLRPCPFFVFFLLLLLFCFVVEFLFCCFVFFRWRGRSVESCFFFSLLSFCLLGHPPPPPARPDFALQGCAICACRCRTSCGDNVLCQGLSFFCPVVCVLYKLRYIISLFLGVALLSRGWAVCLLLRKLATVGRRRLLVVMTYCGMCLFWDQISVVG